MAANQRIPPRRRSSLLLGLAVSSLLLACALDRQAALEPHRWWAGLGPVLPHDTFPADCGLCHLGDDWWTLREDFRFDHGAETGVPLHGAHAAAGCLSCHNDRGPVAVFASQGCAGCHEDVHRGSLENTCESCHTEQTWQPFGQVERHGRTRFPLIGVHAVTACRRCHTGAEVGVFLPAPADCAACHQADLAQALNPNHLGLGWVDNCDRCHLPTSWNQAELDQ